MLVSDNETLKVISKQLHILLKEWNSRLSLSKVEGILSSFVKDTYASGNVFFDNNHKQALYHTITQNGITLPSVNVIEKAFSLVMTQLDGFKEPTRTQIVTAAFAEPPLLFASQGDIKLGKFVDNENVSHYDFRGFSLCSFAYKNKITLDEACAKIQHLINHDVVYCIGCDEHRDVVYQYNHAYKYLAQKTGPSKAIANIQTTKFLHHLLESIQDCLTQKDVSVDVEKLRVVGHIEAQGKLSGALVASVKTDTDVSHLSEDIELINNILKTLSSKVKNAEHNIGYIHFSHCELMPSDFLCLHTCYDSKSKTISKERCLISNIDHEWTARQSEFLSEHNSINAYFNSQSGELEAYIYADHASNFEGDRKEFERHNIELSRFFSNIGPIKHDETPAKLVSTLYKVKHSFSLRNVPINEKITQIQHSYVVANDITSDTIETLGKLNWCVEETQNNRKKIAARNKKASAPYYCYYDLKHKPAKLIAIGTTKDDPIKFFKRGDKFRGQVIRTYAEIKVIPCGEETAKLVEELFCTKNHYIKLINIRDNIAFLFANRYATKNDPYAFEASILKAPLRLNIEPIASLRDIDYSHQDRRYNYTEEQIKALKHHYRPITNYTIQDVINKKENTALLKDVLSPEHLSSTGTGWQYHYQEEGKWAKMTVEQENVHIEIQGEEYYDLHLTTCLEEHEIHLFVEWIPVIISLTDTMRFDRESANQAAKENNRIGLDEVEVDIFFAILENNTYELRTDGLSSALGRWFSCTHLNYADSDEYVA